MEDQKKLGSLAVPAATVSGAVLLLPLHPPLLLSFSPLPLSLLLPCLNLPPPPPLLLLLLCMSFFVSSPLVRLLFLWVSNVAFNESHAGQRRAERVREEKMPLW